MKNPYGSWLHFMFLFFLGNCGIAFSQDQPVDSLSAPSLKSYGAYRPHSGFKLASTEMGEVNLKIFAYVRYVNQFGLDDTYQNYKGQEFPIHQRQDVQLNKVNIQFHGWLLDKRLRYLFYVWTNNTAQGQGAQVVVAGNMRYNFSEHFRLGAGVNSLPGVRTTEGSFPFWLPLDNRLMADEYFRPSYTMGFFADGMIVPGLEYNMMVGNNLSQLGVDAGQLDSDFGTFSGAINWYPTTHEFGIKDGYGDFEKHEKVATRLGVHYTHSRESRQGQPTNDAFENVQIRISDGSTIFQPGLFGDQTQVDLATYQMSAIDFGIKYKGIAIEGEFYQRLVDDFNVLGTGTFSVKDLNDNGYQLLASYMLIKSVLQPYLGFSAIDGEYGDPSETRVGFNWFPFKTQVMRCNFEYYWLNHSPVGGMSVPYLVGSNGNAFHIDFMLDF